MPENQVFGQAEGERYNKCYLRAATKRSTIQKIVKIAEIDQNIRRSMYISEKYDKIIIDADVDK